MKNSKKKAILIFCIFALTFFQINPLLTYAVEVDNTIPDYHSGDSDYKCLVFMVTNVIRDSKTGVITLNNKTSIPASIKKDDNLYVIDASTEIDSRSCSLDDLVSGKSKFLICLVSKNDYLRAENSDSKTVPIVSVGGISSSSTVYGSSTSSGSNIAEVANNPILFEYGKRLSDLKIISDWEDVILLRAKEYVTRADMVRMLIRMRGLEGAAIDSKQPSPFFDVLKTSWAAGYIRIAYDLKIVSGTGDYRFSPDSGITYEDALKMLVSLLGYSTKAQALGGYPDGYIKVADEIKLTTSLNKKFGDEIRREDAILMLHNTLNIPLMIQTVYGEKTEFSILDGSNNGMKCTPLTEWLSFGVISN